MLVWTDCHWHPIERVRMRDSNGKIASSTFPLNMLTKSTVIPSEFEHEDGETMLSTLRRSHTLTIPRTSPGKSSFL